MGYFLVTTQMALVGEDPPANVGDVRDPGLIPGLGRSPGGGHGNSLQYSCLENPMDNPMAGYRPWDHKKSNTTEATSYTHTRLYHIKMFKN